MASDKQVSIETTACILFVQYEEVTVREKDRKVENNPILNALRVDSINCRQEAALPGINPFSGRFINQSIDKLI